MNFSKRSAAPLRFPPPTRGVPCKQNGHNGGGGGGGSGQTPACRGKPCCIKPTDDACFRIAACDDTPVPVAIDGTVDVAVSLGSEPLCVGVEMCGSEPLCVQMENKPDTTFCTTEMQIKPLNAPKCPTTCVYASTDFQSPENPAQVFLPNYFGGDYPLVCAKPDEVVRVKSLTQRFNMEMVPQNDQIPGVLSYFTLEDPEDIFINTTDFGTIASQFSAPQVTTGQPMATKCEPIGFAENTYNYKLEFSNMIGDTLDLQPNNAMVAHVEVPNAATQMLTSQVYRQEEGQTPNLQTWDFKTCGCKQPVPSCIPSFNPTRTCFVQDLQVIELEDLSFGIPFCIVDCFNQPIVSQKNLEVILETETLGMPNPPETYNAVYLSGNKYEAAVPRPDGGTDATKIIVRDQNTGFDLFTGVEVFVLSPFA